MRTGAETLIGTAGFAERLNLGSVLLGGELAWGGERGACQRRSSSRQLAQVPPALPRRPSQLLSALSGRTRQQKHGWEGSCAALMVIPTFIPLRALVELSVATGCEPGGGEGKQGRAAAAG